MTDGGTRLLAEGEGLDVGRWYRAEIAVEGQRSVWQLMALDGPVVSDLEKGIETDALDTGSEVCLALQASRRMQSTSMT